MKAWDHLTETGQFRRLRRVAESALAEWPLEPTGLSLVGGFTNVLFRVDTADGPRALRVDLFQDHSDADAEIELSWMEAIATQTSVMVGRPIRTSDDRLFTSAAADGVPNDRRCTLFEWVPGAPIAERAEPAHLRALGAMAATLHLHGSTWTPPSRPMAWDRTFYWPAEVDPFVLDDPEHAHHFGSGRREILDRTMALVDSAFAEVRAGAQVVHGDLHLENVHLARAGAREPELWAIDFEDVMWAHPVQDIAITLYYLHDEHDPEALRAAYREGYETVRSWPEMRPGQVDTFIAARALMFCNFVLNVLDDPSDFYDSVFPRLERFLDTWG